MWWRNEWKWVVILGTFMGKDAFGQDNYLQSVIGPFEPEKDAMNWFRSMKGEFDRRGEGRPEGTYGKYKANIRQIIPPKLVEHDEED